MNEPARYTRHSATAAIINHYLSSVADRWYCFLCLRQRGFSFSSSPVASGNIARSRKASVAPAEQKAAPDSPEDHPGGVKIWAGCRSALRNIASHILTRHMPADRPAAASSAIQGALAAQVGHAWPVTGGRMPAEASARRGRTASRQRAVRQYPLTAGRHAPRTNNPSAWAQFSEAARTASYRLHHQFARRW